MKILMMKSNPVEMLKWGFAVLACSCAFGPSALWPQAAFAQIPAFADGGSDRGGGDIECDALFRSLASTELVRWLRNGGPKSDQFKLDLSSSIDPETSQPYTVEKYKSKMLDLLALPLNVSCVKKGDLGYPVQVGGASKICTSSITKLNGKDQVNVVCDRDLFMGLNADQKIEQNHHEFAFHVPGLEPDDGPISSYKISLQLAESIADITVRRLVVLNSAPPQEYPTLQTACNVRELMKTKEVQDATQAAFLNIKAQLIKYLKDNGADYDEKDLQLNLRNETGLFHGYAGAMWGQVKLRNGHLLQFSGVINNFVNKSNSYNLNRIVTGKWCGYSSRFGLEIDQNLNFFHWIVNASFSQQFNLYYKIP